MRVSRNGMQLPDRADVRYAERHARSPAPSAVRNLTA
jgi:hypothetical protein